MRDLNLNNYSIEEIWNSDHFKDTRKKMLKGECIKRCNYCYQQERSNLPSHRLDENNIWFQRFTEQKIIHLLKSTNDDGVLSVQPSTIDLRPGNICNLKCVICSPVESSAWYNDAQFLSKNLTTEAKYDWKFKSDASNANYSWFSQPRIIKELIELIPSISHVIFGGGEPLLLKEHDQFIREAINSGHAQNMELRYHTNGSILNSDHIEEWKHFKHVQVMLSIDGTEEINNYIRFPSKWSKYLDALQLLDNSHDNIEPQILSSISLLNFPYISDFATWLLEQKYNKIGKQNHHGLFHPGILFWPKYLSITALPKNVKAETTTLISKYVEKTDNIQAQRFLNIVSHMNSRDDSHFLPQTIEYLNHLDQIRKTNYQKIFTHLA